MDQLSVYGQGGERPTAEQWRMLKKNIEDALAISEHDGQRFLRAALENVNNLDDVVTRHLNSLGDDPSIPTQNSSAVVAKVFETAELAENIFSYLIVFDLLRVQQVNKYSKAIIESSSKLRKSMFLTSKSSDFFRQLPACEPTEIGDYGSNGRLYAMFTTRRAAYEWKEEKWIEVFARFSGYRQPRLGDRLRQMQISQPPIYTMHYSPRCCPSEQDDFLSEYEWEGERPRDVRTISNNDGLNVGDLCAAAAEIKMQHMFCVHAPIKFHDLDGIVRTSVAFQGSVRLRRDDPNKTRKDEEDMESEGQKAFNAVLEGYVQAKMDGKFMKIEVMLSIGSRLTSMVII